ncbi:MAG: DUF368 domain-containing protein [Lachnospiraceae bacterium]|nr:DUF368 domain-containing protein [Lachnospiraceae bacterium]
MDFIKEILRGVLIGIANIIPGVSGGTMMVSMGIYDKIIGSVNRIFKEFVKSIKTLFPYAIGMGVGIVGLSFAIEFLFKRFPLPTAFLFIGLIFGGLPIIWKGLDKKKLNVGCVLLFLLFFALVVGMQFLDSGADKVLKVEAGQLVVLFFVGVIASATMVIPGVSGSMILMSMGYYNSIIGEINAFFRALAAFDFDGLLHGVAILAPFGVGIVLGILAIARLIEFLLNRYKNYTYSAILGLVTASPVAVLMGIGVGTITLVPLLLAVLTFAAGFAVAYFMGKM